MLKPRKRLSRRQIKEDKFVTTYAKATKYINENSKLIFGGIVVIMLLFIGLTAIRSSKRSAEEKASLELARAKTALESRDYESAVDILRRAVLDYSGSKSGKLATLYLADALYEQEEYTEARQYYQQFVDKMGKHKFFEKAGLAGIAACFEQSKEYNEAARYYERAAENHPNDTYAARYLLGAGRCYYLAGELESAKRVFNAIVDTYPNMPDTQQAEMYLGEISAKASSD